MGADDSLQRSWVASRTAARIVRSLTFVLPILGAWLAIRVLGDNLFRPDGFIGAVVWVGQASAVAGGSAVVLHRVARRSVPLGLLLDLNLTFPEFAPSRLRTALRAGSVRRRRRLLETVRTSGLGDHPQIAAGTAIEVIAILESEDRVARGHAERVQGYAEVIADELEFATGERNQLAWGVLLHDIGTLVVPAEILTKSGTPTDDEWEILELHPAEGARLLEPLEEFLGEWGRAAAEHHERFDGSGYPDGLAGREISMAGKITAVADAYDVMTSPLSYKAPMTSEAARNELVRSSGTQFDPTVVGAFLEASVRRNAQAGLLGWLPEAPRLAQIGSNVVAPVAIAAIVVVSAMSALGAAPGGSIPELAFDDGAISTSSDVPLIATDSEQGQTAQSSNVVGVIDDESTSSTRPSAFNTTSGLPSTTSRSSDGSGSTSGGSSTTSGTSIPETSTTTTVVTTTTRATTSTTRRTTTTRPAATTTTAPPAQNVFVFLTNPGSGDTESSPLLPMWQTIPTAITLPNYDTDRDDGPGLLLRRDGRGIGTTDNSKRQTWIYRLDSETRLDGRAQLVLHVGAADLRGNQTIGVEVAFDVCSPVCTRFSTEEWTGPSLARGYRLAVIDLGSVDMVVPAGAQIAITVAVPDSASDVDVWLAYDAASYPGHFSIE